MECLLGIGIVRFMLFSVRFSIGFMDFIVISEQGSGVFLLQMMILNSFLVSLCSLFFCF